MTEPKTNPAIQAREVLMQCKRPRISDLDAQRCIILAGKEVLSMVLESCQDPLIQFLLEMCVSAAASRICRSEDWLERHLSEVEGWAARWPATISMLYDDQIEQGWQELLQYSQDIRPRAVFDGPAQLERIKVLARIVPLSGYKTLIFNADGSWRLMRLDRTAPLAERIQLLDADLLGIKEYRRREFRRGRDTVFAYAADGVSEESMLEVVERLRWGRWSV
jgi:hypothetical protein